MSQHDPNRLDPEWSQFMCAVKSKQLVFTTSAHSMRMRKGAGGTKRESGIHGHDWKTERTAGWTREGAQHAACSPVCEPGVVTPRVMEPGSLTRDISYVVSTLAGWAYKSVLLWRERERERGGADGRFLPRRERVFASSRHSLSSAPLTRHGSNHYHFHTLVSKNDTGFGTLNVFAILQLSVIVRRPCCQPLAIITCK